MSQPRSPETYLAFDYGLRRTGVASGSRTLGRGSPLRTIAAEGQARFAPIEALIREWRPDALVVGVPRHPDGADHENTRRAQRFARQLQGRFGLPVFEVDERYSTTEVLAAGARDADAAAAALLLTQHLDELDRAARAATLARLQEQDPEETNPPKD
ncbi:putative Holliday junction resolvase [Sphaerotilus sulfidivorans]|uniref:Putative pre-16S rRNA nuclease n=1 Tax=Sphaerotilus sulfidivorans TaxID=639200 RepID=A0A5C1PV77_9BURK|nr:Holliday junction resolvase RuvX [Sphaerotilus sulfidivorans]NZD44931.1 Holliday junction resolvase RuvX [Sphaerotilus sulfidivorans]QEM99592.1 Holliday junction resolvase RuvX [Sphaerotilus sulfidivorans]